MAKKYKAHRTSGTARVDLPTSITREIGRIVVAWAYFETALRDVLAEIINLEADLARMAMRDPRPKDALEIIRDICDYKGITYDKEALASLLSRVQAVSSKRDLICHGIWGMHSPSTLRASWYIQSLQGSWPKQTTIVDAPTGIKRRLVPYLTPMDTVELRQVISDIDQLMLSYRVLRSSMERPR